MKTKNKLIITAIAIVAITTMSFAVIGCEEEEPEQPSLRNESKTVKFDNDHSYEVTFSSGSLTFLAADWESIVTKITNAFKAVYGDGKGPGGTVVRTLFDDGVTVIVEKDPVSYTNYKVGGDDLRTLYLNVDNLESVDYTKAMVAMYSNSPYHEDIIGKVKKVGNGNATVPDTVFALCRLLADYTIYSGVNLNGV
jgi:hypothetical protein